MEKYNREKSITERLNMQKKYRSLQRVEKLLLSLCMYLMHFLHFIFPIKRHIYRKKSILIYSSARFHVFTYQACECQFQRSNRKAPLELKEFETTHWIIAWFILMLKRRNWFLEREYVQKPIYQDTWGLFPLPLGKTPSVPPIAHSRKC